MNVDFSLTVPMFQTQHIGWLILESLARQEKIDFSWELIIAEETKYSPMGEEEIFKYQDGLQAVGCIRIKYIPLDEWIPLGAKMMLMRTMLDPSSRVYMNSDADQFLPPLYLKTVFDAMWDGRYKVFRTPKWILYELAKERTGFYDVTNFYNRLDQPVLIFARDIIHRIQMGQRVDYHIPNGIRKLPRFEDKSDNWKYGVGITGLNNCSTGRPFGGVASPPFFPCPIDINDTIPKDIMDRLKDCRQYTKDFKRGLHTKIWEEQGKK